MTFRDQESHDLLFYENENDALQDRISYLEKHNEELGVLLGDAVKLRSELQIKLFQYESHNFQFPIDKDEMPLVIIGSGDYAKKIFPRENKWKWPDFRPLAIWYSAVAALVITVIFVWMF